jgi:hypothetical protein
VAQWRALLRVVQGVEVEFVRRSLNASGAGGDASEYPFSTGEISPDTRKAAHEHGGALFAIIKKSLALRIYHEGLNTPVLLDDDTMWCLEDLICALATEISDRNQCGLWTAHGLNKAMANFLRDLFALVHPSQTAILVKSYFKSMRNLTKQVERKEQMDLKFDFLEKLLRYDYVQINRPWLFGHPREEAVNEAGERVGDIEGPEAHWLARITTEECLSSITHPVQDVRERGISILRAVLVQHSYELCYQEPALREGIAAMYLPFIGQLVQRADALVKHQQDRRELLACLIYVLQNSPNKLLRGLWRHILSADDVLQDDVANRIVQQSAAAVCQNGSHGLDNLLRVLELVEMSVDTFEYPFGNPRPGMEESAIPLTVLVPHLKTTGGPSSPRGTITSGGGASVEGTGTLDRRRAEGGGPVGAEALQALNSILQDRTGRTTRQTGRLRAENQGTRQWKQAQQRHDDSLLRTSTVRRVGEASQMTLTKACKWVCHTAGKVILQVAMSIAEEVVAIERERKVQSRSQGLSTSMTGGLWYNLPSARGSSVTDSGNNVKTLSLRVYKLLLHVLMTGQSDLALIDCLEATRRFIEDIGIESFLDASNHKSDWLRQTIIYSNHPRPGLRNAARDFLLSLMHSTFVKTGSVTGIRVPLYHVFLDSLSLVWGTIDKAKPSGANDSPDVVRQKAFLLLAPLLKCIKDTRDNIQALLPAGTHSAFTSRALKVRIEPNLTSKEALEQLLWLHLGWIVVLYLYVVCRLAQGLACWCACPP